jgi:hypothetical protein
VVQVGQEAGSGVAALVVSIYVPDSIHDLAPGSAPKSVSYSNNGSKK